MTHQLRLHLEPFTLIKVGKKSIESRLHDEKRQTFKVGDILIFISREDDSGIKKSALPRSRTDLIKTK